MTTRTANTAERATLQTMPAHQSGWATFGGYIGRLFATFYAPDLATAAAHARRMDSVVLITVA